MRFSRRRFLGASALTLAGCATASIGDVEPVIDIHQHTDYGGKRDKEWNTTEPGRSNERLLAHQKAMGVTRTVLLPAGRFVLRASTHQGFSNGLNGTCGGNEACRQ